MMYGYYYIITVILHKNPRKYLVLSLIFFVDKWWVYSYALMRLYTVYFGYFEKKVILMSDR
ncbi:MAG: hypothetical protein O4861_15110 [Trichodesmium sp. St16_bin4-tuft]|nr:hypothetical protein [Trichodesmium sp. MAG_R01]MDE5072476.1 hypothetical protein [Trichodesmium sp. St5_bin8]MDE5099583.1 hypothetical protein [Trichodesmium sp. St16_bin4-tuft]